MIYYNRLCYNRIIGENNSNFLLVPTGNNYNFIPKQKKESNKNV